MTCAVGSGGPVGGPIHNEDTTQEMNFKHGDQVEPLVKRNHEPLPCLFLLNLVTHLPLAKNVGRVLIKGQ